MAAKWAHVAAFETTGEDFNIARDFMAERLREGSAGVKVSVSPTFEVELPLLSSPIQISPIWIQNRSMGNFSKSNSSKADQKHHKNHLCLC
jgi:hypothetical protein